MKESQRVPSLDLLRAQAIMMVLLFHYGVASRGKNLTFMGDYGFMGVDLFFVLSGFLIGSQFFKSVINNQKISIKKFYFRRIFRTIPNYLVVLGIYYFFSKSAYLNLPPLWKFLTFTQNFGLNRIEAGSFSHAWSLCIEEQFYLIFPILSFVLFKHAKMKTVVSFLFSILILGVFFRVISWLWLVEPFQNINNLFSLFYDKYIYYPSYNRFDGLLVGIVIAMVKIFRPTIWGKLTSHWIKMGVAFVILFICSCYLTKNKYHLYSVALMYPCIAICFGALLLMFLSPKFILSKVSIPGVKIIATLSYGMYLLHNLVLNWSLINFESFFNLSLYSVFGFILFLLINVFCALILYLFVEKPFLILRERF